MNSVTANALPSRIFIAVGLAIVGAGVVTYALHTSPITHTAQVAPAIAPPPPPPPVAQTPPPAAAIAEAPAAAAPAPAVPAPSVPATASNVSQASSSGGSDQSASVTPRHTAKAHSRLRSSDDGADSVTAAPAVAAATPPAPAAPAAAPTVDSTADASAATSNAQATAAPVDVAGVDSKITTEVKSRLAADTVSKDANIGVTTTQGVVVLTGTLATQDAIDHVKEVAQNVPDVKSVDTSALKVTGNS